MSSTLMGVLEVGSSAAPTERLIKSGFLCLPLMSLYGKFEHLYFLISSSENPDIHKMLVNKLHVFPSNNFQTATS